MLLFSAYIKNSKLKKTFSAVSSLVEAEHYNPSLLEQFAIYVLRMHIEKQMVEEDTQVAEHDGLDVKKISRFQANSKMFKNSMIDCVDNSHEFWSELLKNDPDIEKLLVYGNKINENLDKVVTNFENVKETFPNHADTLQLYGEFKNKILFEKMEG